MRFINYSIDKNDLVDLLDAQYSKIQDFINSDYCSVVELQYNSLLFFIVFGLRLYVYREKSGKHYVLDEDFEFLPPGFTSVVPFT